MINCYGTGFFVVESFVQGTKYMHLGDWVVIAEDALKVSIFNAIREV